ncbi:MAG: DUF4166 domain-containing protein, partial [Pseudonocardia sp.]|nr:DUF4166 domain-containing protein [Pseudonocardia sp.]
MSTSAGTCGSPASSGCRGLGRFRIDVAVTNQRFGPLFGYRGTFTAAYAACRDVPARVKPREQAPNLTGRAPACGRWRRPCG